VQFLVHVHGFFDLIILDENGLSLMELLVKNSKSGLNTEVISTFCSDELVKLSQIVSLRNIAESSVASFSDIEILLLKCELGESFPVGFSLRSEV